MIALAKMASGPHGVRLTTVPDPQPGAGEAVIDVIATGLCSTDVGIMADRHPSRAPVVLGREVTGTVSAVGSDADRAWLGVRVAVESLFSSCGVCATCRAAHPHLCADGERMGSAHDGGFAPRVAVPVANLHRVPERVGEFGAALIGPLAAVVHALVIPQIIAAGDRVLVVGPGTTGFLAAQAARAAGGIVTVAGLGIDVLRLESFAELGFDTTAGRPESEEFDVAVECSGSESGAATALDAVRRRGRCIAAAHFDHSVTVPLDQIVLKEVTLTSGFASTPESWERAVRLVGTAEIDLDAAISEVIGLDRWADAVVAMHDGVGMKVLLDPRTIALS